MWWFGYQDQMTSAEAEAAVATKTAAVMAVATVVLMIRRMSVLPARGSC